MRFLTVTCLLLTGILAYAQQVKWEMYDRPGETGTAAVLVDMQFHDLLPDTSRPFLLITGITMKDCLENGLAQPGETPKLYEISGKVVGKALHLHDGFHVGTVTRNCRRYDYLYMSDTFRLEERLQEVYAAHFPEYEAYLTIREDSTWQGYLSALYPTREILEYLGNEKLVLQLYQDGDDLSNSRPVEHQVQFMSKDGMLAFETYAIQEGFTIQERLKDKAADRPFALVLTREDYVDVRTITAITTTLREKVQEYDGIYEGWATVVIR